MEWVDFMAWKVDAGKMISLQSFQAGEVQAKDGCQADRRKSSANYLTPPPLSDEHAVAVEFLRPDELGRRTFHAQFHRLIAQQWQRQQLKPRIQRGKLIDHSSRLRTGQGAYRINQSTAGFQRRGGVIQELQLEGGQLVNVLRSGCPSSVGIPLPGPDSTAGCVHQYAVKLHVERQG